MVCPKKVGLFQFKVGWFKIKARTNLAPQNYMYLSAPGCLTEMGINPASMNFHAVHRVGKKKPSPTNSTEEVSPRQIIVRFISRKDRDNVWENRGKVKNST